MTDCFHKLTDSQWQIIEKILDNNRKRWHSLRTIFNAILWINRTGAQWRELDKLATSYPPWQTVYYHFRQFKLRGVWEELLDSLVVKERQRQQREDISSLLAIDSQFVKTMQFISEQTGIDGHKLINGRKRSIAVDRLALP
jgi:putative transposase